MFGFKAQSRRLAKFVDDCNGSTLMFVIATISVMALLSLGVTRTVVLERNDVYKQLHRTQSFHLADAGVHRARYEKAEGTFTNTMPTGNYSVTVTNWGTDGVDNDNDTLIDESDEAGYYAVVSNGTAAEETTTVEAVIAGDSSHELFYHHAIYAGNSSGEPYNLELAGQGVDADNIDGAIYVNGDIDVSDDATIQMPEPYTDSNSNGQWDEGEPFTDVNLNGFYDFGTEASGNITGTPGLTGGDTPINPPDVWSQDLEALSDVRVANAFASGTVTKLAHAPNPAHNTSVTTVPESSPAYIFAKGVLNDYGPVDDAGPLTNENYFLWDAHEYWKGRHITVNPADNNMVYYIDGNLWVEVSGISATLFTQPVAEGTRLTVIVKGNIYLADELLYQNPIQDGISLIAVNDGETYTDIGNGQYDSNEVYTDTNGNSSWDVGESYVDSPDWRYTPGIDYLHDYGADGIPNTSDAGEGNGLYEGNDENSGNILLGDPNVGPVGDVYGYLYAQNNFVDYVLGDSQGTPEDFTIHGTMSAGNQVRINRARNFGASSQHTKMEVIFDNRLREETLELPYLPGGSNRVMGGSSWQTASWYR